MSLLQLLVPRVARTGPLSQVGPTIGSVRSISGFRIPYETVSTITLSSEVRARLLNATTRLPSPYADFNGHCAASSAAVRSQLGPHVLAAIEDFRTKPCAPGALLIAGLPLDLRLPPTPTNGGRSVEKQSFVSEGCLTGIVQLLGTPFAYASEKNGEMIHNICPVRHREAVQSNESSAVQLSLHTENAYFNVRPDYLTLYCLRQDHAKQARTLLAGLKAAFAKMDPRDVVQLQQRVFLIPSPPSHHGAMGGEKWSEPRALFETPENTNLIYHFPGMKALDPAAQQALDRFREKIHSEDLHAIALEPGNLLLVNNRKVGHGRSHFAARYDGVDRWLQRMYVRASIDGRAYPESRVNGSNGSTTSLTR